MDAFSQTFQIRWSDVDANAHVRHSAYLDYCATLRMSWLKANGFSLTKLASLGLGPILFKESISYFRELKPDGKVTARLHMAALSETGHKWVIDHEILNEKGEVAAKLHAEGAWFDTKQRKVIPPPEDLLSLMKSAAKSESFQSI